MKTQPPFPDILCIGSLLWDIVGRTDGPVAPGGDVPGRIARLPGGVAMNIAMTAAQMGMASAILSAVGSDAEGDELLVAAKVRKVDCRFVSRTNGPTDRYIAIESPDGMIAAVADARTLEAAGVDILAPLADGRLGTLAKPWEGLIALDGNLTEAALAGIAASPLMARADVRIASAGSGKASRLGRVLSMPNATLYLNLEEAAILCGRPFAGADAAAAALLTMGARRVLVTDGARAVAEGRAGENIISALPPQVAVTRLTGAGDTFMAAHIAAQKRGLARRAALEKALSVAAQYITGEIGT